MHELLERTLKEASQYFRDFLVHEYVKKSSLHNVDARLKFLVSIIFVLLVLLTFEIAKILVVTLSILAIAIASGVSVRILLKRSWLFTFFSFLILLPASLNNFEYLAAFVLRVMTSILAVQLFVVTTPFSEVCAALRWFRVPKTIVDSVWLTYRYAILLFNDLLSILLARASRRVSKGSHLDVWRHGGKAVGTFFLRAFERAEMVELATKARGNLDWKRNWKLKEEDAIYACIAAVVVYWWWTL
ncbi:MAG: cobalt ECF transporter T component CbiQ [Archaeoglobaceae archaeon]